MRSGSPRSRIGPICRSVDYFRIYRMTQHRHHLHRPLQSSSSIFWIACLCWPCAPLLFVGLLNSYCILLFLGVFHHHTHPIITVLIILASISGAGCRAVYPLRTARWPGTAIFALMSHKGTICCSYHRLSNLLKALLLCFVMSHNHRL